MKLIFIAGYPRSGSTILDVLIRKAGKSSFISIGEFFYIFEKGYINNEFCADGIKFLEHPFWQKILKNLNVNLARKEFKTFKNPFLFPLFFIIGIINRNYLKKIFPNLFEFLQEVFSRINKISNHRIIIDASKDPRQLFLLSLNDYLRINIIHLLRDSRATSFSWKKKKIYKDGIFFKRKNVFKSSLRWLNDHIWILLISKIFPAESYKKVIYEKIHLITNFRFFGENYAIDNEKISTKYNVEIGGNINKFQNFKKLTIDKEWVEKISYFDFIVVTVISLPLLILFKYKIRK